MPDENKGLGWEIKKSIHLVILACFPIINSFAYFLMNKKIKQKKWKVMGWVFLLLQLSLILGIVLANSFVGNVDNYGSSPKLEDYLGANYYAEYGSDYKTRPEYEQYLKDLEEWEETPELEEQKSGASGSLKEDITTYAVLCFYVLHFAIFITTCIQRDKYLKLLKDKESEEEKTSDEVQLLKSEMEPQKEELSMRWFEFVIYIYLFLAMVLKLVNAGRIFSGYIYEKQGIEAATVYSMYPNLSAIDKFGGVMELASAIMAICVRQRLAKYKKNGPNLYLLFFIVQILTLGIYNMAVYWETQSVNFSIFIGQICSAVIMIVGNKIYFDKRKDLFVN